jgi:hypothetical protein
MSRYIPVTRRTLATVFCFPSITNRAECLDRLIMRAFAPVIRSDQPKRTANSRERIMPTRSPSARPALAELGRELTANCLSVDARLVASALLGIVCEKLIKSSDTGELVRWIEQLAVDVVQ